MLNAAIIGLGAYGQRLVAAVQGKSAKIRFVAGAARTVEKAARFAAEHGFPLAADCRAVLADPEIEAVVLATPHSLHAEQVKQAARAGKHVFVEKPFTLTRASAEDAARACEQHARVLAVGFNRRFRPAFVELKRLAARGALGTVLHIEGQISGPPGGGAWHPPGSWGTARTESPAGGMTGKGIHIVDAMIALAGPIASVYATSERRAIELDIDDTTSMLFRFTGGATGYLGTILSTPEFWRLHVFGTRAWAEMRSEHTLAVCEMGGGPRLAEYAPGDTQRAELEAFADAIAGGAPYPVTAAEAICSSAVLEAIERSARTGSPVATS